MTILTRRQLATAAALAPMLGRPGHLLAQAAAEIDRPDRAFFLSQAEGEAGADLASMLGPGGTDIPYWALLPPGEQPRVGWAPDPASPDYLSLAEQPASADSFRITADTLFQHATLNSYALPNKNEWPSRAPALLFGLRGCTLVSPVGVFAPTLELRETAPDHLTFRCTIGILRPDGTLAGFPASTVCNADYMYVQTKLPGGKYANLLPTGLHLYKVGTHRASSPNPLPSALVQQRLVTVLRSRRVDNNVMQFRASDDWDGPVLPFDNIHVAYGDDKRNYPLKFDSAGCQVIPGYFRNGRMTGPWAEFCRALGTVSEDFTPDPSRNQEAENYSYMLLTGREARLLAEGTAPEGLRRLRFGSSGAGVLALRARLRQTGTSNRFDAETQRALIRWQQEQSTQASSILTPEDAGQLGLTF